MMNILKLFSRPKVHSEELPSPPPQESTKIRTESTPIDSTVCLTARETEEVENDYIPAKKLHPVIFWEPLQTELQYPTQLDCINHLNAYARDYRAKPISGNFIYNPPMGTILDAGHHELHVTFAPSNRHKYMSMVSKTNVFVKKAKPYIVWAVPDISIVFGTPLTNELLFENNLSSSLTGGSYIFTHSPGQILEIGTHIIGVEYDPSKEDKVNYTRAYAAVNVTVVGVEVPVEWKVNSFIGVGEDVVPNDRSDKIRESHYAFNIVYPDTIPAEHYVARCCDPDIKGKIVYDPPIGTPLDAGIQTLNAVFYPENTMKYRISTASVKIGIKKGSFSVIWTKVMSIYEGYALGDYTLNCKNTLNLPGTYVYTPPAGTFLLHGMHTLRVVFYPDDSINWNPASMHIEYKILPKKDVTLYWPIPFPIQHPAPITKAQLNACVIPSSIRGTFEYEPKIDTILDAGEHTLFATFHPDKPNFKTTTTTVKIEVLRATAKLVWNGPETMRDGDRLFENVLNCICSNLAGGTFVYTPPMGSVPPLIGANILHVSFTPSPKDIINYAPAEATVTLLVREKPKTKPELKWQDPAGETIVYPGKLTSDTHTAICTNVKYGMWLYTPLEGTVLDVGTHRLKATFEPPDSRFCLSATIYSTINVVKGYPAGAVWQPEETVFFYGVELDAIKHLNAKCMEVAGEFVYDPPEGTVLESGDRLLKCKFTPYDTHNYYSIDLTTNVFVHRVVPVLTWLGTPLLPITYPTPLYAHAHLKLSVSPAISGTFKFNHKAGTRLPAGTHTITTRFYPDDLINYLSADQETSITVIKGDPIVSWQPDFSIIYEAPLNSTQHLNANSDLEGGSYVYNVKPGHVPDAEENFKMTVHYTPQDVANYNEVSQVRYLRVDKRLPLINWDPPLNMKFGNPLSSRECTATLSETSNSAQTLAAMFGCEFIYSPALGSIVNVPDGGIVQFTVNCFPPKHSAHNYSVASRTMQIKVHKTKVKITWKPMLLQMVQGSPLSETHLCAKVDKPKIFKGHFEYSHQLGDILPVGRNKIEATFIPSEPYNVIGASEIVSFEVTKRPPTVVYEKDEITGVVKSKLVA